jgi:hypothetical protein
MNLHFIQTKPRSHTRMKVPAVFFHTAQTSRVHATASSRSVFREVPLSLPRLWSEAFARARAHYKQSSRTT